MKKIIITEKQRGLLFQNGKYKKLLAPGRYRQFGGREIIPAELTEPLPCQSCPLTTLLADRQIAEKTVFIEVPDEKLALHFVNGQFRSLLFPGQYAFWTLIEQHSFQMADLSTPVVEESIPRYIFPKISPAYYLRLEVAEYQKGLLFLDQKLTSVLAPGSYYFWKTPVKVELRLADTRLTQFAVTGQEVLSADKVTLRINFVCHYRLTDPEKALTEIDDYKEELHVAAQLALREYAGRYKLDEILENKEQLSRFVFERLKAKEKELFLEIADAGIKDIILPGEIREIMNTVLVAEKRAQANVITRREEVASTRSLLNTARLMEENQTLYKLKELEYVERICENVGNITLNGNGGLLTQLTELLNRQHS